jgi:Glycosyl transferase family 64 domain
MASFLRLQFSYLLRTLPYRHSWRYKLWTVVDAARLVLGYLRLTVTLRFSIRAAAIGGKTCGVVLLAHNRPQNMSLIVQGALRNQFVTRVIVSNSNPHVKLTDWIRCTDSRLILVDEAIPTQPGHRLVLASDTGADYVLSIDDDIFLTPKQWRRFFEFLIHNEEVPHGIVGQIYRPGTTSSNGSPFHHVIAEDTQVDVLIGAFAFTREHLNRVFRLAADVGISDVSQVRNGEDILLSFSGTSRPQIHAMRPALFCASEGLPGIALWRTDQQFWDERIRMFEKVQRALNAMKTSWMTKDNERTLDGRQLANT